MLVEIGFLTFFLVVLNFLPFLAYLLLGDRFDTRLDGGIAWLDHRPLLGPHKTLRGLLASVIGGVAIASLAGFPATTAAYAAMLAMTGDLATSFVKRRLGRPSGSAMFGLDQVLEGALPLLVLVPARDVPVWSGLVALAIFIPLSHLGSQLFHYALGHPPTDNYPRIIRAPTRLREFRACHVPSSRWHHLFNFENYFYYRVVIDRFFRAIGRYRQGVENVLAVDISERTFIFDDLPEEFDGFRILLLTDLHLDGLEPLTDVLIGRVRDLEVDICLIGGDIRMELYGPIAPSVRLLRKLVGHVHARHGKFGVLGNHDCIEMLPDLEDAGVSMLINEAREITHNGSSLWLIGVDDPHFYKCDDLEYACSDVPLEAFKILLAHSPEIYHKATDYGIRLYLCGHTHGGQICLPWLGPLFTHSSAPRYTAAGHWTFGDMIGYTSRGAGASGVPLRYNCPGEIPLITLRSRMPKPTV